MNHTGTLATLAEHPQVQFGLTYNQGTNVIDRADLKLARGVSAQLAGEIVAHEALEAYRGSLGEKYDTAHRFANQFFGRTSWPPVGGPGSEIWNFSANTYKMIWQFGKPSMTIETTFKPATLPRGWTPISSNFQTGTMTRIRRIRRVTP